jgi:hypothetical protein
MQGADHCRLPSSKNIQISMDLYLITLRSPPEKGMSVHLHNELSKLLNENTIKQVPKHARNIKKKIYIYIYIYCIYSNI